LHPAALLVFVGGVQLKFWRVELRLAHPWRIARNLDGPAITTYPVVFVELHSPDGRIGRGEAAPSERYNETADTVEACMRWVDPRRFSFDNLDESLSWLSELPSGNEAARAALDVALVDGAARTAGKPIYAYFRLGFTEGKHLTSFSIGIDTPEMIQRKVQAAADFPVLKLKVGSPHDLENLAALRQVAPQKPVRLDANEAWKTKEEALRHIEALHRFGPIQFIEQPLPASAPPEDMAWLKARSPLPLFADESYQTARDVDRCAQGFHGVNVKLVKAGGLTRAYDALQAARRAGLKTMIGCMIESSLLITAAAHLAELADYLDLDGNLLITNDPFVGVRTERGVLSFKDAPEPTGLRVSPRPQ